MMETRDGNVISDLLKFANLLIIVCGQECSARLDAPARHQEHRLALVHHGTSFIIRSGIGHGGTAKRVGGVLRRELARINGAVHVCQATGFGDL